jgi:hypothetical protein
MEHTLSSVEAETVAPRDTATKPEPQRLSVLELAAERGNAAEAYRQRGIKRQGYCL